MIKIITPGTVKETTTVCYHCGCVFSYDEGDTRQKMALTWGAQRVIDCPCCGTELSHPTSYKLEWTTNTIPMYSDEEDNKNV